MSMLAASAESAIAGCSSHANNIIPQPFPVDLPPSQLIHRMEFHIAYSRYFHVH